MLSSVHNELLLMNFSTFSPINKELFIANVNLHEEKKPNAKKVLVI